VDYLALLDGRHDRKKTCALAKKRPSQLIFKTEPSGPSIPLGSLRARSTRCLAPLVGRPRLHNYGGLVAPADPEHQQVRVTPNGSHPATTVVQYPPLGHQQAIGADPRRLLASTMPAAPGQSPLFTSKGPGAEAFLDAHPQLAGNAPGGRSWSRAHLFGFIVLVGKSRV